MKCIIKNVERKGRTDVDSTTKAHPSKTIYVIFFVAFLSVCALPINAQVDSHEYRFLSNITTTASISPYGKDIENLSLQTGKFTLSTQDGFLRGNGGLDISLIRSYRKYNATPHIGNWEFEIPQIVMNSVTWINGANYSALEDNQCAKTERNKDTWGGIVLRIPGQPDRQVLYKDDATGGSANMITTDNWRVRCSESWSEGGAPSFTVTSPNGIVYHMDLWEPATQSQRLAGENRRLGTIYWKVNRVTDTFYNTLIYNYESVEMTGSEQPEFTKLKSIVASDGRVANFTYYDPSENPELWGVEPLTTPPLWGNPDLYPTRHPVYTTEARFMLLKSIELEGREWNYIYDAGNGNLLEVVQPDQRSWHYSYQSVGYSKHIDTVTYPFGGTISYSFLKSNTNEYINDINSTFLSLESKIIKGYDNEAAETIWYSYNSAVDVENIADPDLLKSDITYRSGWADPIGHRIEYIFHRNQSSDIDKQNQLIQSNVVTALGNRLQSTFYEYEKSAKIGTSYVKNVLDNTMYRFSPSLTKRIEYNSEGNINATSNIIRQDFDDFGNPRVIKNKRSTIGVEGEGDIYIARPKEVIYSYYNDLSKWILGKVASIEYPPSVTWDGVERNNKIVNEYFPDTGGLKSTTRFGKKTSYTYFNGDLATVTDANEKITSYSRYYRGLPGKIEVDGVVIMKAVINLDGTIYSREDEVGNRYEYLYDGMGNTTEIGLTGLIIMTPNSSYRIGQFSDYTIVRTGNSIVAYYKGAPETRQEMHLNGFGQVVKRVNIYPDLPSASIEYRYDALGRIIFESLLGDDTSKGLITKYDEFGRVVELADVERKKRKVFSYLGQQVTEIDESGEDSRYLLYDSPSELVKVTVGEVNPTIQRTKYNDLGQVVEIENDNSIRTFEYDKFQMLEKEIHPERDNIIYSRDNVGNIKTKHIQGKASFIFYDYDSRNRLTKKYVKQKIESNSILSPWSWGVITDEVDYTYHNNDALESVSNDTSTISYRYNMANQLISENIDIKGKQYEVFYSYNILKNLTYTRYPSGEIVTYRPDDAGRPTEFGRFSFNVLWHPNGALKELTNNNGTSTTLTLIDQRNNQLIKSIDHSPHTKLEYEFYYETPKIKTISQTGALQNSIREMSYYDGSKRLGSVSFTDNSGGGSFEQEYFYDNLGNIRSVNSISQNMALPTNNLIYNYDIQKNQLTSISGLSRERYDDITYDDKGNITSDGKFNYTYDNYSRLVSVNSPNYVTYEYDGNDHLIYKRPGTPNEVYFFYTSSGKKILEYRPGNESLEDDTLQEFYYLGNRLIASKILTEMHLDDSDADGISDAYELANGLNMSLAYIDGEDADGDGLTDLEEAELGTSSNSTDSDNDGLDDAYEVSIGTNPLSEDSDGDGTSDSDELAAGSNPRVDEDLIRIILVPIVSLLLG